MPKKVKMSLVGLDGNAFSLLAVFSGRARRQGWSQEEIKAVIEKAKAGDYDNLLRTLMENIEDEEEDDD